VGEGGYRIALAEGTRIMVSRRAPRVFAAALLFALIGACPRVEAGPEISLREFASGQIKKGVRSIGMGGDGATLGNYSLVWRDAGSAVLDDGAVHYGDTGNSFTFTAVGFTTPSFWDDAAVYVIAMSQQASAIRTWTETGPSASKPPSTGEGSNQAVFVKAAKPLGAGFSLGILLPYELSQMTLLPDGGSTPLVFRTA